MHDYSPNSLKYLCVFQTVPIILCLMTKYNCISWHYLPILSVIVGKTRNRISYCRIIENLLKNKEYLQKVGFVLE